MSRIGKKSIKIPEQVLVKLEGKTIKIVGPRGELERTLPQDLSIEKESEAELKIVMKKDTPQMRSLHGTTRALIANMIKGVSEGWTKKLELVGTGYRAQVQDNKLVLYVGYSHPVSFEAPDNITFKVEKTEITIEGIDKELVGQIAANIRAIRAPEPYKGKGIKYKDEVIRRKAGKVAKAMGAA